MTDPEKQDLPPDVLDHLEQLHRKLKDQQDAWRRLLEKMDRMAQERIEKNTPNKHSS
jgi:hypothetical protein